MCYEKLEFAEKFKCQPTLPVTCIPKLMTSLELCVCYGVCNHFLCKALISKLLMAMLTIFSSFWNILLHTILHAFTFHSITFSVLSFSNLNLMNL